MFIIRHRTQNSEQDRQIQGSDIDFHVVAQISCMFQKFFEEVQQN